MKMLDKICIGTMIRANMAKDKVKEFLQEQDGVSNVVATIIILLIVVLLIGAFWDRLKEWINAIMDQIFGTSYNASGLGGH
ncbi:MAG: Flp1 family type IVb pilin [Clostridiaceae bacterium]